MLKHPFALMYLATSYYFHKLYFVQRERRGLRRG
jgi:hypothetical protein